MTEPLTPPSSTDPAPPVASPPNPAPPVPAPPPALVLRSVTKIYPDSEGGARELNMTVPVGAIHGFLGRNGAGKTTTMKCIMGLLRTSSGTFQVLGSPYLPPSDAHLRTHLGYAPELASLPAHLSGREALEIYGRLRGLDAAECEEEMEYLLNRLELRPAADLRVNEYSKGMKARLAVAMAMMGDPEVLILDEPTSGLDPVAMAHLRDLLHELVAGPGGPRSILLSSHQLSEVEKLCTSLTIIDQGHTVAEGTITELMHRITGGTFYRAEVQGLTDALAESVARIAGFSYVARIEALPGGLRFRVEEGVDPREALARHVVEGGGLVLSCNRESISMEDLFLAFVEGRPPSTLFAQSFTPVPLSPPPTTAPAMTAAPTVGEDAPVATGTASAQGSPQPAPAPTGTVACPKCGQALLPVDKFCFRCGAPFTPPTPPSASAPSSAPTPPGTVPEASAGPVPPKLLCPKCQNPLAPDDAFCFKCGTRIVPPPVATALSATPSQSEEGRTPTPETPVSSLPPSSPPPPSVAPATTLPPPSPPAAPATAPMSPVPPPAGPTGELVPTGERCVGCQAPLYWGHGSCTKCGLPVSTAPRAVPPAMAPLAGSGAPSPPTPIPYTPAARPVAVPPSAPPMVPRSAPVPLRAPPPVAVSAPSQPSAPPRKSCGRCGTPNSATDSFCIRCGARLAEPVTPPLAPVPPSAPPVPIQPPASPPPKAPEGRACPACGTLQPVAHRHCEQCGASMSTPTAAESAESEEEGSEESQSPTRRPCPYCGGWNEPEFLFCQRCGKKLPAQGDAERGPGDAGSQKKRRRGRGSSGRGTT